MLAHRYSRQVVIGAEPLTGRESELGVIRLALTGVGNHCGVVIAGGERDPGQQQAAAAAAEQAGDTGQDGEQPTYQVDLNPFERGPEFTETR